MPLITVREPAGPPVSYQFEQQAVAIGRAAANDLILRDPSVSRHHVEIRQEANGWVVEDLGSRNGTRLNGSPLPRPEPLAPGDEISVGDTVLVFGLRVEDSVPEGSEPPTKRIAVSARGTGEGREEPALVGKSLPMRNVLATIERIAPSMATVLILGDNGTGKELAARLIHHFSPRRDGPFVAVNCPGLPGSLLESELFGVEKGVATGVEPRPGRFETAEGGTLLLDEIGDMSQAAQAKILRVLEEKTVERLGGREPLPLDIRMLASTNHDLKADMAKGAFRRDLYHRLNTVTVTLPPLRKRREDIPLLVEHFLSRSGEAALPVSPEALDLLMEYHYPGNVRELERIVERALLLAGGPEIQPADLPDELLPGRLSRRGDSGAIDIARSLYKKIVEDGEDFWDVVQQPYLHREISKVALRRLIEQAYEESGRSYKGVARLFGIEQDHKKLLNFLRYHDLRVKK